jgi:hypothetical protein
MAGIVPICRLRRGVRFAALAALAWSLAAPSFADDEDIDIAKERKFWSFQRPVSPKRPEIKNKRWPRQELDYFVLSRLEARKLTPSDEAGKTTLIRRLAFDLTGLPPTSEEVSAFLKDKRRDAYEWLVDRLLASPRFGEHLASMWLPLARYAEDQAHQVGSDTKFFYPNAYKYRDWIIAAFNRDLPYDEFVRLQLAADKMDRTNDLAALGFLGLGPKYYNRNRLDVIAWTRSRELSSDSPSRVRAVTTTNSIRSRARITMEWPESSRARRWSTRFLAASLRKRTTARSRRRKKSIRRCSTSWRTERRRT